MIRIQNTPGSQTPHEQPAKHTQAEILNASRLTGRCLRLAREVGVSDPEVISGLKEIRRLGELALDPIVERLHGARNHEDVFNKFAKTALEINKEVAAEKIGGLIHSENEDTVKLAMKVLIFPKRVFAELTLREVPPEVLIKALLNDSPLGNLGSSKSTHLLRALNEQAREIPDTVKKTLEAHRDNIGTDERLHSLYDLLSTAVQPEE